MNKKRKKKRYEEGDANILQKVSDQLITKETLKEKLTQHVEKVSFELHAVQVNVSQHCHIPYVHWYLI